MNKLISVVLIFSIVAGQIIKIPVGTSGGIILLDLAVIFLCFLGLYNIKFRLKTTPSFIKAALVFIAICLISLLLTPIKLTLQEFIISFSYIVRFAVYILMGWLIYQGAFPSFKKTAAHILIISGVCLAMIGLLQLIFLPNLQFLTQYGWDPHYFRTVSTFLDPNFLGSFLALTLLLILQNSKVVKKRNILFFGIIYLALLTTFSRGAYLAFFTSFTLISILNKSLKQAILTIILSLGLFLGFYNYQSYVAEPRGIERYESAKSRQDSWREGWQLFLNSPFLGVGFNSYRFALREYNLADEKFLQSHGSSTNDSSLLYVASTTGLLGFVSYLFFLFSLVKHGLRQKLLPAALLGLISQSFFANVAFYPPLLFWVILEATYRGSLRKPSRSDPQHDSN